MRSSLQKRYDDLYYNFVPWYTALTMRLKARKDFLFRAPDAAVKKAYDTEIRPYWARFGLRPTLPMIRDQYAASQSLDPRYITDDIWVKHIVPFFNNPRYSRVLADKNLNGLVFPEVRRPETLFRRMSGQYRLDDMTPISRERAMALCATPGTWVIKPTIDSFRGKDVTFFDAPAENPEDLFVPFGDTDFIVQRAVVQHPALMALNPTSVNTVRVMTYVLDGEAHVESVILRIGAPGSHVDNLGAGGLQCAVNMDGTLADRAFTKNAAIAADHVVNVREHPLLKDLVIPGFQTVIATALALAAKMPHLHLIAWDFAVDETETPVLIEFNTSSPGQNQETNGPTFGDRSEAVLGRIFNAGKGKK